MIKRNEVKRPMKNTTLTALALTLLLLSSATVIASAYHNQIQQISKTTTPNIQPTNTTATPAEQNMQADIHQPIIEETHYYNLDLQAQLNSLNSGQTLTLPRGIIHLNTTLYLKAAHSTLQGNNTTLILHSTTANMPLLHIKTPYTSIANITFENTAPGLYTTSIKTTQHDTTIKNNTFTNSPIAITLWADNNTISYNHFSNHQDEAIAIISTTHTTSNHNMISYNTFENTTDGVELQKSKYNTISHNIFRNTTHAALDLIGTENNHNMISHNTIINSTGYDIYIGPSSNNTLRNNTLTGTLLTKQATLTLENNTIKTVKTLQTN